MLARSWAQLRTCLPLRKGDTVILMHMHALAMACRPEVPAGKAALGQTLRALSSRLYFLHASEPVPVSLDTLQEPSKRCPKQGRRPSSGPRAGRRSLWPGRSPSATTRRRRRRHRPTTTSQAPGPPRPPPPLPPPLAAGRRRPVSGPARCCRGSWCPSTTRILTSCTVRTLRAASRGLVALGVGHAASIQLARVSSNPRSPLL